MALLTRTSDATGVVHHWWRFGWAPGGSLPYTMLFKGWRYRSFGALRWPRFSLIVRYPKWWVGD